MAGEEFNGELANFRLSKLENDVQGLSYKVDGVEVKIQHVAKDNIEANGEIRLALSGIADKNATMWKIFGVIALAMGGYIIKTLGLGS